MTEDPYQTAQLRARTHHAADTFVADRKDRDLLFCFISLWLGTRVLCTPDHRRRFR